VYVPGYYNTVNKRILIIANKRIHIISAYFLAAANDKRMRLLTSLYGMLYARVAMISHCNLKYAHTIERQ